MMLRRWPALLAVLAALAALWLVTDAAADELSYAGLVIRHGDGRLTYAYVAFPEESISGIELLRRSGVELVTVSFGGLGEGVCQLDGEGCPASECRRRLCRGPGRDDPYWQYVRQVAPGDWQPVPLGASSTRVRDGDIDGWSWTGRDAGLPALTIEEVARLAGVSDADLAAAPGAMPTPAMRTVHAGAAQPSSGQASQGIVTYLGAAALIALLSGGALLAARRRAGASRGP